MAKDYAANNPEDKVRDLVVNALRNDEMVTMALNPALFGLSNKKGLAMVQLADGTVLSFVIARVQVVILPEGSEYDVSETEATDETNDEDIEAE